MIKKGLIVFTYLFFSFIYCQAQTVGKATYYHNHLHGHRTSDGGKYHKDSLTCAHRTYPFGTYLQVKNPVNGKTVIVKVTDRGPFSRRLIIDLSYRAAQEIGIVSNGYALVEVTEIPKDKLNVPAQIEPLKFEKTPAAVFVDSPKPPLPVTQKD